VETFSLSGQSEIEQLHDKLEVLARETEIPPEDLHKVQLAIEEYLTNVFKYAFEKPEKNKVTVRWQLKNGELCIEFEDEGRAFNLLEYPAPDLSVPLDERPIGGLGIHMIRQSMDRIEYRRSGGKNIVLLAKRVKTETP